jgi:hypothetical protein
VFVGEKEDVRGDDVGREVSSGKAKRAGCGLALMLQWRVVQDAAVSRRSGLQREEGFIELGRELKRCKSRGAQGSVSCWKLRIGCHVRWAADSRTDY